MRNFVINLLGFAAVGGRFQATGNVIPANIDISLALNLPRAAIAEAGTGVPSIPKPVNPVPDAAPVRGAPGASEPHSVDVQPVEPLNAGDTPGPGQGAAPVYPGQKTVNPPPAKQPGTPDLPRINNYPEAKSLADAINRGDYATTKSINAEPPCHPGKRDLVAVMHGGLLSRESGETSQFSTGHTDDAKYAQPQSVWAEMFEYINKKLQNDKRVTKPIVLSAWGRLPARATMQDYGAKTSSLKFLFHPGTTEGEKQAFWDAAGHWLDINDQRFKPGFLDNSLRKYFSPKTTRAVFNNKKGPPIWETKLGGTPMLEVNSGPYDLESLVMMKGAAERMKDSQTYKPDEITDIVGVLEAAVRQRGGNRFSLLEVQNLAAKFSMDKPDADEIIYYIGGYVQRQYAGFRQDVSKLAKMPIC